MGMLDRCKETARHDLGACVSWVLIFKWRIGPLGWNFRGIAKQLSQKLRLV